MSFFMDYTALKKLGLEELNIDIDSIYEVFDSPTHYDTIFIHLNKSSEHMVLWNELIEIRKI